MSAPPRPQTFHRTIANAAALYLSYFTGLVFNLVAIPLLSHSLSVEDFAAYLIGLSVVGFVVLLHEYGFNLGAVRDLAGAGHPFAAMSLVTRVTMAKVILSTGSLVAALAYSLINGSTLLIWLPLLVGIAGGYKYRWYYQARLELAKPALVELIAKSTLLAIVAAGAVAEAWHFFAIWLALELASALTVSGRLIRVALEREGAYLIDGARYLHHSFSYFSVRLLSAVFTVLPTLILAGLRLPPNEIAVYGIGERVARVGTALITPISDVLYSRIVGLKGQAVRLRSSLILTSVGAMLSGIIFLGAPVLPRLVGAAYEGAVSVTRLLSALPLIVSVGTLLCIHGLVAEGRVITFRRILLASVAVFALLGPVLSLRFHSHGMAMGVLAAESTVVLIALLLRARRRSSGT